MLRKTLIPALLATLASVLMTAQAQAWGVAHVGFTHVGPNGVYHAGRTAAVGPSGGSYYGGRAYGGTYGGYHAGYSYGTGYRGGYYGGSHYYSPSYYGGYYGGGVRYGY